MAKIIPGILTSSEVEYQKRLRQAEHVTDLIQIDVIDGKFANNTTVASDVIKKYPTSSSLEIQLMVLKPENYIDELVSCEYVSRIIIPFEINTNIGNCLYQVKKYAKLAGLSLNPTTPVTSALEYFEDIDVLLLMTAKPGFSGQKLGEDVYKRIHQAKKISPTLPLEIDIGVNFENAQKLARAGADFLVAASTLYSAPDFYLAYEKLAKLALRPS